MASVLAEESDDDDGPIVHIEPNGADLYGLQGFYSVTTEGERRWSAGRPRTAAADPRRGGIFLPADEERDALGEAIFRVFAQHGTDGFTGFRHPMNTAYGVKQVYFVYKNNNRTWELMVPKVTGRTLGTHGFVALQPHMALAYLLETKQALTPSSPDEILDPDFTNRVHLLKLARDRKRDDPESCKWEALAERFG